MNAIEKMVTRLEEALRKITEVSCADEMNRIKGHLDFARSLRDEERKQGDGLVKELEDALRHGFKGDNNGGLFFMPSWFENKIWDVLSRHAAKEPTK